MFFFLFLFISLLQIITCVIEYPKCDYYQELATGQTYYFFSPRYDKNRNYLPGTNCRWRAQSPNGTVIGLACVEFNVPSSSRCSVERLLFSPTGRVDLLDGTAFCGKGTFVRYSETNKATVALQVERRAKGGRFLCEMSVQGQCSCGRRQVTRIVGGDETLVNEFTMMASLFSLENNSSHCGATIISDRYLITAAHCIIYDFDKNLFEIRVGEHNFENTDESAFTNTYKIEQVIPHSDFNDETQQNDIALIRVDETILFNTGVGPVCLPFKFHSQTFVGRTITAVGWGSTSFAGPVSPYLQKVDLDVVSNSVCQESYDIITDQQICTYGVEKDTCQYDSGGPLLYTDTTTSPPHLYLVGIVNFGIGCASGAPSVSARVTEYLEWIRANTAGTTYCDI